MHFNTKNTLKFNCDHTPEQQFMWIIRKYKVFVLSRKETSFSKYKFLLYNKLCENYNKWDLLILLYRNL